MLESVLSFRFPPLMCMELGPWGTGTSVHLLSMLNVANKLYTKECLLVSLPVQSFRPWPSLCLILCVPVKYSLLKIHLGKRKFQTTPGPLLFTLWGERGVVHRFLSENIFKVWTLYFRKMYPHTHLCTFSGSG